VVVAGDEVEDIEDIKVALPPIELRFCNLSIELSVQGGSAAVSYLLVEAGVTGGAGASGPGGRMPNVLG